MRAPSQRILNLFVIALAVATLFLCLADVQAIREYSARTQATPNPLSPSFATNPPLVSDSDSVINFVANDVGKTESGPSLDLGIQVLVQSPASMALGTHFRAKQHAHLGRAGEQTNHQPFLWIFWGRML